MNAIEKEKATLDFFDKMGKIGDIKNPLLAMREYIKISDWIGELYEKGYKEGFKEGEKSAKNVRLN
jgi:hypothetical protein